MAVAKKDTRRTLRSRFATPEETPRLRIIACTMGPGKAQLLGLVAESGSISEAARRMGMSYLRAWKLVDTLNASFHEPLVKSGPGGRRGGGSTLTPMGLRVLALYRRMQSACLEATAADLRALHRLQAPSPRTKQMTRA